KSLLKSRNKLVNDLTIIADDIENSKRIVEIVKVLHAYQIFEEIIAYYGTTVLLDLISQSAIKNLPSVKSIFQDKLTRTNWVNLGG
ncbi:hypothetical protein ACI4AF_29345, partial [Klebsiella pneumoniae]|uniref:hypothetical protein n=1 Tax=Klebsiella pneumoniae TaxID=573 RepID=UPI003853BB96